MREKFTPWEVTETFWAPDPWNPEAPRRIAEYNVKGEGLWVSGIHKKEHAQLLASAPDLYAALEAVLAKANSDDNGATWRGFEIEARPGASKLGVYLTFAELTAIEAALLKARGTEKEYRGSLHSGWQW